jgi:hypothetical protein
VGLHKKQLKTKKLPNRNEISAHEHQDYLFGGGEAIGDLWLIGVVVVSAVGDMAENSGFVYREPVLEVGWVWDSRKVVI